MTGLTLDAGALIAYELGGERIREILAVGYARGFVPTIPAIALAEVWRGDGEGRPRCPPAQGMLDRDR